MTPADAARLALAKRAYEANRPREAEVQAGVRRARLALRRPKLRRNFWSKGLVLVVLAMGSFAYAKPHQLSAMIEQVLHRASAGTPSRKAAAVGDGITALASARAAPAAAAGESRVSEQASPVEPASESQAEPSPQREPPDAAPSDARALSGSASKGAPQAGKSAPSKSRSDMRVSTWGRVGRALASGDETTALAALSELGQSRDSDTRDKADLGRAQLLLARGNRDEACALARSLLERDARGRIQRQAWALVTSCAR